jgi:uncharacterized membrane protein YgdD (TMEM256/DUF423 family)
MFVSDDFHAAPTDLARKPPGMTEERRRGCPGVSIRSIRPGRADTTLAATSDLNGRGRDSILLAMTNVLAMRVAALVGLLAVALGAFGAHGLKDLLARNQTAAIWEKAVFYHFIHAVMLVILAARTPLAKGPWFSFFIGIVIFSGSLYVLAWTNVRWWGAVTPFGGLSFIVGWLWLFFAAGRVSG